MGRRREMMRLSKKIEPKVSHQNVELPPNDNIIFEKTSEEDLKLMVQKIKACKKWL